MSTGEIACYAGLGAFLLTDVVVTLGVSRCFLSHRWSKWQGYTNTITTKHYTTNGWTGAVTHIGESTNVEHWQARQCDRCGIAQRRNEAGCLR